MSEQEIETVVLDEALVQEIIRDKDGDGAGEHTAGGRVIRLDPALKRPATPDDGAGN